MPVSALNAPRNWRSNRNGHVPGTLTGNNQPGVSILKPKRMRSLFGRMSERGPVPYVSQLGQGHWNDESNCGPTCLTMVGRAFGIIPPSDDDLRAIDAAGRMGGTRASGTSAFGLAKMADAMGLDFQQVHGVTPARIAQWLQQGALVVVRGNAFAVPWNRKPGQFSAHVVLVTGVDANGRFQVNDPYDPGRTPRAMTADELAAFGEREDFRDKPFTMAVGRLAGPFYCREVLPGTPRI